MPCPPVEATPRPCKKRGKKGTHSEDESSALGLLVTTELEVLASLERELCLGLKVVSIGSVRQVWDGRTLH
jgi:hypothetical protein